MTKKYDIAVKVGEYTDSSGATKGRYQNVGAVIQGDNGPYIVLDRTFNPAGVPNPQDKSSVILSLFAPKEQQQKQPAAKPSQQAPQQPPAGFDDDIPF